MDYFFLRQELNARFSTAQLRICAKDPKLRGALDQHNF